MNKIRAYIKVLYLISKWPFKICLGDTVFVGKEKFTVCNGTTRPYWTLRNENRSIEFCHQDYFKKPFFRNVIYDLRSGYNFYMGYWFDIWSRE